MNKSIEEKLALYEAERLSNDGGLSALDPEQVNLGQFYSYGDALRIKDPIKYTAIQRNLMIAFVKTQMQEGQDYGLVQGIKEKFLFKAGAERLATLFNCSIRVDRVDTIQDYNSGLFAYTYKATVYDRMNRLLAQCEGTCNSKESKYAYRNVNEQWATPEEKAASVGTKKRKDKDTGKWITMLIIPNDDIFSIVNTIMKMAQKRAYVGAVILACNASSYFKNAEAVQEVPVLEDRPQWDEIEAEVIKEKEPITGSTQVETKQDLVNQADQETTLEKFLDMCDRAVSLEQLKQAQDWLNRPAQWGRVKGIEDIEAKVNQAIEVAKNRIDSLI